jgi:hypothetical protein
MKKLLALGALLLFIGMTAMTLSGTQDRGGNEGVKDQFVGAWRLASLEGEGADWKVHRCDSTGMLCSHGTATCRYRSWNATRSHKLPLGLNSIRAYAPHDGVFELRIPGLHASRASRTNEECVHALRLPCLSTFLRSANLAATIPATAHANAGSSTGINVLWKCSACLCA